ncbi:MAG: hypothetical protein IJK89_03910 [Clostridia bacterium]|nr:hypothetical protein [Clostridia bacterium]
MSGIQIDTSTLSPTLQTAYSYLAEGNWRNANDCFDLELKQSPLDPFACLGKAMTANCLKTPEELSFCNAAILDDPFFSAALKYAEDPLKNELTQLVVRLNYDRQKAAAPQAAIETAGDRTEAADFTVMTEPETAEPVGRSNWDMEAYTEKSAAAATEPAAEKAEEALDVVPVKKKSRKKLAAVLVIVFVLLLGAGAAAAWFYLIPLSKYNKAVDLINNKQFDDGLAILEELGDFSDAPEQYKTGLYVKALNLLANNEFDASKEILEELGDFKDAQELIGTIAVRRVSLEVKNVAAAAVGDVVVFGRYETDGNTERRRGAEMDRPAEQGRPCHADHGAEHRRHALPFQRQRNQLGGLFASFLAERYVLYLRLLAGRDRLYLQELYFHAGQPRLSFPAGRSHGG